jgi:hypothetical protein
MLSRTLTLATVTLLIGGLAADPAHAQATNLEAGKSPSQIFAGTCNACHKSPRGLLRTVPASSLPGFLREHYTTSSEMAGVLSSFLISNGATDTRYVGGQAKPTKDAKSDARPAGPAEQLDRQGRRLRPATPQEAAKPDAQPQQAAKPDADGLSPQGEPGRLGRNGKRLARPGEPPDAAKPGVDAAKLKLSKRGKPDADEPPKTDAAKPDAAKDVSSTSEPARDAGNKAEAPKPSGEGNSDSGRIELPKASGAGEPTALRPDPVPAVTPAPKSAEGEARPVQMAAPSPGASAAAPAAVAEPAQPAVTASAPPPAPVMPADPPAPPISQ